jgi:hypothetical protein
MGYANFAWQQRVEEPNVFEARINVRPRPLAQPGDERSGPLQAKLKARGNVQGSQAFVHN